MQPAQGERDERSAPGGSPLRKWGPIAALVAVIVVVAVIVLAGGGDDEDDTAATDESATIEGAEPDEPAGADDGAGGETADDGGAAADDTAGTDGDADAGADGAPPDTGLPDGVISFTVAQELGLDIDFGERCDPETGLVRVPNFYAPECYAPFEGDNGGETAPGVTADAIRIVYWQAQDADPILNYITDAIVNDDTNADVEDTMRALLPYYETYYETYGRSVDFVFFEGSGNIADPVSARADAVQIAEEFEPFMVWGGPTLTNAFAEELAARGIPCLGCGPGQDYEFYESNDPTMWSLNMGPNQTNLMVADFVAGQLAGKPAEHAGDEALAGEERVFGRLWIESSEQSVRLNESFEGYLADQGVELAASVSYALNPATIQESAASAIARLKDAGVTTVLFSGDPVAPRDFTREATAQGYFPEWFISGSVLVDTNVFARTYDQEQWANAFGLTTLGARVMPGLGGGPTAIYEWFHGEPPAADDSIGVLDPFPGVFYAIVQGIGPNLTAEAWRDAIFAGEPTRRAVTNPTISWGDKDRWPDELEPDYFGIDDMTIIWWDRDQVGIDELRREAPGMYQFVDGGRRYLLGEFAGAAPVLFDPAGAVSMYDDQPADEPIPTYDPLPAG